MQLKWISRSSVLLAGAKTYKYGDNIPSGIHKDKLNMLKKKRCIGTIVEAVASDPDEKDKPEKVNVKK